MIPYTLQQCQETWNPSCVSRTPHISPGTPHICFARALPDPENISPAPAPHTELTAAVLLRQPLVSRCMWWGLFTWFERHTVGAALLCTALLWGHVWVPHQRSAKHASFKNAIPTWHPSWQNYKEGHGECLGKLPVFLNFQGKCTLEVLREYYFCFVFSRRAKLDPEAAEASEWTIHSLSYLLVSVCSRVTLYPLSSKLPAVLE